LQGTAGASTGEIGDLRRQIIRESHHMLNDGWLCDLANRAASTSHPFWLKPLWRHLATTKAQAQRCPKLFNECSDLGGPKLGPGNVIQIKANEGRAVSDTLCLQRPNDVHKQWTFPMPTVVTKQQQQVFHDNLYRQD